MYIYSVSIAARSAAECGAIPKGKGQHRALRHSLSRTRPANGARDLLAGSEHPRLLAIPFDLTPSDSIGPLKGFIFT